MGNRNKNHKKPEKWFGNKCNWELHHIDRNPKNLHKTNEIMLPPKVHDDISKRHNSYRKGPLPNNRGENGKDHIPRVDCERLYKRWITKTKWTGIDPNNGDQYSDGILIKSGPKQLDLFT